MCVCVLYVNNHRGSTWHVGQFRVGIIIGGRLLCAFNFPMQILQGFFAIPSRVMRDYNSRGAYFLAPLFPTVVQLLRVISLFEC